MPDQSEIAPLLSGGRPTSEDQEESHENAPLLAGASSTPRYDGGQEDEEDDLVPSPAATSLRSHQNEPTTSPSHKKRRTRWITIIASLLLGLLVAFIVIAAFFGPAIVEEYAKESLTIEPTNLSIHAFTSKGVTARIQAVFRMDASRVHKKYVRDIGRFGTWLAREVETKETTVEVYLPEYGNVLIGSAAVPRIAVDIRDGHGTGIDVLTDLQPGDLDGIRRIANDWLEGRLNQIRVLGKADVALKSGLIPLGSQQIAESLMFEASDIPAIPDYNITRLNFHEVPVSTNGRRGMGADVSLSIVNTYPIALTVPPLSFDILVPNCGSSDPYIRLADATTDVIKVEPFAKVGVEVGGIVREMPEQMLQNCPGSHKSPLDVLLEDYIHGNETTIFVRGSSSPAPETPDWIAALMASVTVPVPFPGHTFDKLIKSFSLTDVKFKLPGLFSGEDDDPTISGNIVVLAGLPKEMNFGIDVSRVRASADVFYKGKKLGVLDLKKWQHASSERVDLDGEGNDLKIQSRIQDAPLKVTDEDVFQQIVAQYIIGGPIALKVVALVDVEISTVLGALVVKNLPAEGVVPVKPISGGDGFAGFSPKIGDLKVLSTGTNSLNLQARVNFTNPTEYSAVVPYFNIHILNNGSIIGDATARNVNVGIGNNTNLIIDATWDPMSFGGSKAKATGRELLSQYISGLNTTLTFRTHEGSILHQPKLGTALSAFDITIPTPRLKSPATGDGDDQGDHKPHFIDDTTFHLLSSTATFTLISPLQYSTIYIENINATAYYNHTEPVGHIDYDLPFKVPPGSSESPRLPVDWSLGSVGYDAIRNALGGSLKLDAKGVVRIRLGNWTETVWYLGSGIGASIHL